MTIKITTKQLETLQEEFCAYFYESMMNYEPFSDYEFEENRFINRQLGTDNWVLKDTIEQ